MRQEWALEIKTYSDARLKKDWQRIKMLFDRGKEYVRCYKYETENALVLLLAFYTPSGVVEGPSRARNIG